MLKTQLTQKAKQIRNALVNKLEKDIDTNSHLLARLLIEQNKAKGIVRNIQDTEFRVYSQWGDDGIIQYLVNIVPVESRTFVEFGVENYTEANTRFLLINNNWSGLVIDGSNDHISFIKNDPVYWKYDLHAISSFITAENINDLLTTNGFAGKLGLLHIDIDGNDYWVWKAITVANPCIVIMEYNSIFGPERTITVPYKPEFVRGKAHHSLLYSGASLAALCNLAAEKGYVFVGSNTAGNNAYFVRTDLAGALPIHNATSGYIESRFREARDASGKLTFPLIDQRLELIRGMEIFNTTTSKIENL